MMAKTQMQLANRAWRTETKSLGWHHGWKAFCRKNAAITVEDWREGVMRWHLRKNNVQSYA